MLILFSLTCHLTILRLYKRPKNPVSAYRVSLPPFASAARRSGESLFLSPTRVISPGYRILRLARPARFIVKVRSGKPWAPRLVDALSQSYSPPAPVMTPVPRDCSHLYARWSGLDCVCRIHPSCLPGPASLARGRAVTLKVRNLP